MASKIGSWVTDWDYRMSLPWRCEHCEGTWGRYDDGDYCEDCVERLGRMTDETD